MGNCLSGFKCTVGLDSGCERVDLLHLPVSELLDETCSWWGDGGRGPTASLKLGTSIKVPEAGGVLWCLTTFRYWS